MSSTHAAVSVPWYELPTLPSSLLFPAPPPARCSKRRIHSLSERSEALCRRRAEHKNRRLALARRVEEQQVRAKDQDAAARLALVPATRQYRHGETWQGYLDGEGLVKRKRSAGNTGARSPAPEEEIMHAASKRCTDARRLLMLWMRDVSPSFMLPAAEEPEHATVTTDPKNAPAGKRHRERKLNAGDAFTLMGTVIPEILRIKTDRGVRSRPEKQHLASGFCADKENRAPAPYPAPVGLRERVRGSYKPTESIRDRDITASCVRLPSLLCIYWL